MEIKSGENCVTLHIMNNDVIHLLPDSVANQIAAGEVIQRPASVVKELVENSIDSGATSVQVIIKDAGRTLIQVVDNGCGMSPTDARLAFERHATSKIRKADDLYTLHTMGFRGEALPSVAAVSEIDMRTMRPGDTMGTRLLISASKVESQQPEACVPGTNMMVKKLFFNLPARRKFLKKDPVELSHIVHEFERLALVNTSVDLTLTHNDVVLHQLMRGTLKQRIGSLFGKSIEHQIIPVETETSIVRIDGFVGLPQNARKRGALQYFFVNGRNMRHPYFHKAVLQCYQDLIPADSQPNYFINFHVDPETIDVNIHPQKHEIKFENEQPIWQILVATVKESLGRFNAVPSIDFDSEDVPDIPVFDPKAGGSVGVDLDPDYNPFGNQTRHTHDGGQAVCRPSHVNQDWEKLYDSFASRRAQGIEEVRGSALNGMDETPDTLPDSGPEASLDIDAEQVSPGIIQLKNSYIITPSKSGLMFIDQHRAHVRILYERYLDLAKRGEVSTQRIIFPEALSLDPAGNAALAAIADMLGSMGFDLSYLGNNSWAVNGVPSVLTGVNPADAVQRIVSDVMETGEDTVHYRWQSIALSMARAAAIKRGDVLSTEEMDGIMTDLFRLSAPNYTPDGKIIVRILDMAGIRSMFS